MITEIKILELKLEARSKLVAQIIRDHSEVVFQIIECTLKKLNILKIK